MEKKDEVRTEDNEMPAAQVQVEIVDEPTKEEKEKKEDDDVKDSWDADTTEDEHEEEEEGIYLHTLFKSFKDSFKRIIRMADYILLDI